MHAQCFCYGRTGNWEMVIFVFFNLAILKGKSFDCGGFPIIHGRMNLICLASTSQGVEGPDSVFLLVEFCHLLISLCLN